MRASRTQQTGEKGTQQVKTEFTDWGWTAIEVPQAGDIGTDLYVQVFDERRHALRLVLGVQVRSGPSQFNSPVGADDGMPIGWWCSDSREHFDYWSTHALPHLIVLRDLENRVSYWVHVTPDKIEPAGDSARILVPRDQVLSSDQADDLVKVAASQKAAPLLEGLAVSAGIDDLPYSRWLRCALIAPRLVTPPRAAGFEDPICAEEAIALIAAGRFRDLKQFADAHEDVPDPDQIGDDASWPWRFVAAMWDWAITDSIERLGLVFESAPDDQTSAASGVLLACALRRQEQIDAGTAVLDRLADRESMHPVDRGWVLAQRARDKIEIGDVDGAHAAAVEAQGGFAGDRDDVTVSALKASAAWSLYYAAWTKRFDSEDFTVGQEDEQLRYRELLVAFDTAISWWRSQEVSAALSTEQDKGFRTWARDGPPDEVFGWSSGEDRLFAAELNADLTAEHSVWCSIAELRGQQRLMGASKSDEEDSELVEGLDILRRAGRGKALGAALDYLLRVGPADAIARSVRKLPRTGWTSTTVAANLEALSLAGQFLEQDAADELLLSCTGFARGDTADLPRCDLTPPGLIMAALDGAAGLMAAADDAMHTQVARDLAELPSDAEHAYSMRIGSVLEQLEWDHVETPDRERLRGLAGRDNARSVAAVLGWFSANGDEESRAKLGTLAATGDLDAVSAIADLGDLSDDEARALLGALSGRARTVLSDARKGTYGGDRDWLIGTLAHVCAAFPLLADWEQVFALLVEPSVATGAKRAICTAAVEFANRLPDEVGQQFVSSSEGLEQLSPMYSFDDEFGAIGAHMLYALGALSEGDTEAALIGHAVGTHAERRDAAYLALALGNHAADIVLVMLAHDKYFTVRSNTAYCIGRRIANSENSTLDATALEIAVSKATIPQLSLLNGLRAGNSPRRSAVGDIAAHLKTHPSARVRRSVKALERDS